MIALLFLAAAFAADPTGWVLFDICQIDFTKRPPVAARQRDHSTILLRAEMIHAISSIDQNPTGLKCVQLGSASGQSIFVIGTREQVIRKLANPNVRE